MEGSNSKQVTGSRRTIVLAVFAVVVIGIITTVVIYGNKRAPFRSTVLEVNDSSIKMDYFLKRVALARENPMAMLQTLANEEIIKQTAPHPPYSIRISEKDIDLFLREVARDRNFKSWYRRVLDESRFSDSEYRDLVRTILLTQRLTRYLEERVPSVAEQIHLHMIAQGSVEDAHKVKQRLDAGEDFFTLARELNTDEQLKALGGDMGWFPRGELVDNLARTAFDELKSGHPSAPLIVSEQLVLIVMVSERAAARQIEEESLQKLKSKVLEGWLFRETRHHRIAIHGLKNGYDAETDAWVQWQLQKMRK